MIYNNLLVALALSSSFVGSLAAGAGGKGGKGGQAKGVNGVAAATGAVAPQATSPTATTNGTSAADLALNPSNVQTGSDSNGLAASQTPEVDQTPSDTDPANFINFCTGKTLTNGLQVKGGSCNGIVMGDIPASTNMISTIIVSPQPGQNLDANVDFNVTIQMANIVAGSFTNAEFTYYAAPQQLQGGSIVGHSHITIQTMGNSLTPTTPLDASTFVFFKGLNDAGNGKGLLSATVAGGLPAGFYRVCTMASSSNHQPALMPVAQRGAQDDCTKMTVGEAGAAGAAAPSGGAAASGAPPAGAAAPTAAAAPPAVGGKQGAGGNKGFGAKTGHRMGRPHRFTGRAYVA
ncbi:Pathogenicity cluster 5 protein d [Schaereria dolodes]|nr:Pathogenicity cluster 5 protein d [Schaereria dolodes]